MEPQQFHNLGFQSEPRDVTKFLKLEVVSRYEIWDFHCGEDSFCGLLSYDPPGYTGKVQLELHSYKDDDDDNSNSNSNSNNNNNNNDDDDDDDDDKPTIITKATRTTTKTTKTTTTTTTTKRQ